MMLLANGLLIYLAVHAIIDECERDGNGSSLVSVLKSEINNLNYYRKNKIKEEDEYWTCA